MPVRVVSEPLSILELSDDVDLNVGAENGFSTRKNHISSRLPPTCVVLRSENTVPPARQFKIELKRHVAAKAIRRRRRRVAAAASTGTNRKRRKKQIKTVVSRS